MRDGLAQVHGLSLPSGKFGLRPIALTLISSFQLGNSAQTSRRGAGIGKDSWDNVTKKMLGTHEAQAIEEGEPP